jgi:hypothetical protein
VPQEELYTGTTRRIAVRVPVLTPTGGVAEERVEVEVRLLPGSADGQRFRIPGGSRERANVIVTLKTRPHTRFVRHGDDLVCHQEVSLFEALTGARQERSSARSAAGTHAHAAARCRTLPCVTTHRRAPHNVAGLCATAVQASTARCATSTGAQCA